MKEKAISERLKDLKKKIDLCIQNELHRTSFDDFTKEFFRKISLQLILETNSCVRHTINMLSVDKDEFMQIALAGMKKIGFHEIREISSLYLVMPKTQSIA
jgi:hypothetical protein